MRTARLIGLLLLPAFLAAAASASAAQMDVRLGLWEATVTSKMSGAPPIDVSSLNKLSPEQRARLEAMFQSRAAQGPQTHSYKTCLTKEDLEKDPFSEPARQGETCTTKVTSHTRTMWQGTRVCTGDRGRQEYSAKISVLSREQVKGTVLMKLSDGSHTMTNHATYSGKWLGSDCGGVR
ncbi:MAG TPA: DUF3617 domain-containing protein [Burkholderiales bacterium]|nr:DUF3617 domain-containing protein [Burkholderiales bacterium]